MKKFLLLKFMQFINKSIWSTGLAFFLLVIFPSNSKAFDFQQFNFDFDFYLPPTIIYPVNLEYEHFFTDYSSFTGMTINNLNGQELTLEMGFDPALGFAAGELVQPGFLLLDGTLALAVSPTDSASGRAAIRAEYRMAVDARALGRQAIERRIRTQLGRDSGRIGARARLSDARLMRFVESDSGGTWIRAANTIRNMRRAQIRNMGDSLPDGILGHYGYQIGHPETGGIVNPNEAGYVWAVLDTNSKYAVGVNMDHDSDGVANSFDNCPYVANSNQADYDEDLSGDACDTDDDNDAVLDENDNCPLIVNADQADFDGDLIGDACDLDDDNDNVNDGLDTCLYTNPGAVVNNEGCSIADLCPCLTEWKNHGAYVRCVAHATEDFVENGLITESDKDYIVSVAGESSCGQKR